MYSPERSILHLNVTDFAVAVERVIEPTLKDKALIIGHMGATRAIVHDMSEEAFQAGVRKGMKLQQATRMCKGATLLSPRFSIYQKAMLAFLKTVYNYTPLVEHGSSDGHIFLDVTGTHRLFGPPVDVGWRMQREVQKSLRFTPIWALATNKLVAKVASRLVRPVGEYIVGEGEEESFLAPLPISILPGINNREKEKLYEFNLTHIGQLANLNKQQLNVPFGKRSIFLHEIARGIDASPVVVGDPKTKPITFDHTFVEDTNDTKQLEGVVARLAAKIGVVLRDRQITGRRMGIYLTYSDGGHSIRQATRKQPSSNDFILTELSLLALTRAWTRRTRLRSCKLSCDLFQPQPKQLSLFSLSPEKEVKQNKMLAAMDTIRTKYGEVAIQTGLQSQ